MTSQGPALKKPSLYLVSWAVNLISLYPTGDPTLWVVIYPKRGGNRLVPHCKFFCPLRVNEESHLRGGLPTHAYASRLCVGLLLLSTDPCELEHAPRARMEPYIINTPGTAVQRVFCHFLLPLIFKHHEIQQQQQSHDPPQQQAHDPLPLYFPSSIEPR